MGPVEITVILLAGLAAGTINTVVGSGTLISFPTLLALGVPPVTANVSNGMAWRRQSNSASICAWFLMTRSRRRSCCARSLASKTFTRSANRSRMARS